MEGPLNLDIPPEPAKRIPLGRWWLRTPDMYVSLKGLHQLLESQRLQKMREQDDLRILQHRDINIDSLRHRMLEGKSPKKTMVAEVLPIWEEKVKSA